jgi:SET domain-containing protein
MVNHSRNPNLKQVIDGERVYLQTTRPIHPGEELFSTYGEGFFEVTEIDPDSF